MKGRWASVSPLLICFLHFASILRAAFPAQDENLDFPSGPTEKESDNENENSVECVESLPSLSSNPEDEERLRNVTQYLNEIHNISNGTAGSLCLTDEDIYRVLPYIPIGTQTYKQIKEKVDLIAYFMPQIKLQFDNKRNSYPSAKSRSLIYNLTLQSLLREPQVENLRLVETLSIGTPEYWFYSRENQNDDHLSVYTLMLKDLEELPWFFKAESLLGRPNSIDEARFDRINYRGEHSLSGSTGFSNITGFWTWPYFRCNRLKTDEPASHSVLGNWLISYSVAFAFQPRIYGLLSFDVDLTPLQINQCDAAETDHLNNGTSPIDWNEKLPLYAFHGTHKCDNATTKCKTKLQKSDTGWLKGNYVCVCNARHHALRKEWNNTISGYHLESKWCASSSRKPNWSGNGTGPSFFNEIASCRLCPEECPDCVEKKTCLASTSFPFRVGILCVSVLCAITTIGLIVIVYKCRRKPVFTKSSPIFLCITLIGCIVMYSEMAVLFPVLSIPFCVAVKWTRHLGFCITYTALYMKLCRVYLTFRVKSAHKIKLTEKHLLHWMSPILVIMLLYLFAWTISDPPDVEVMNTTDGKRFYQCIYNWWDHALAIGEVIFLAYGVWICWRIRENPDAQFISYSIYNIALVNVVMVTLHLLIVPKAGPDMKYLLAFLRVQLSTTITIGLVLGSKLYRTFRGEVPTMKEVANSANGFGHDTLDLDEENLQLKEELQKMATQIERLKSYAMCKNNPHLKNATPSSGKIDYGRLDSFTTL